MGLVDNIETILTWHSVFKVLADNASTYDGASFIESKVAKCLGLCKLWYTITCLKQ